MSEKTENSDEEKIISPLSDGNDSLGTAAQNAEVDRIAALNSKALEALPLADVPMSLLQAVGKSMGYKHDLSKISKLQAREALVGHRKADEDDATEKARVYEKLIEATDANPGITLRWYISPPRLRHTSSNLSHSSSRWA